MKRVLLLCLASVLALAACGTPQEQCISAATRDLRVLEGLIKETEANLTRGYALEQREVTRKILVDCTPRPTAKQPKPKARSCWADQVDTVTKPVAIDLNAEQRKLASMRAKRQQLMTRAETSVAQCRAAYPE